MTNRYYNIGRPIHFDYEQIEKDLRNEGVSEYEMMFAMERRTQTMLRVMLSREIALCDIDDKPCSSKYCSTCLRNRC